MKIDGQSVTGGEEYPRNTVIQIFISQGNDKVKMPSILGKSVEDAKSMLFDAGFYSDTIILTKAYDATALPGQVFKVTYSGVGDTESNVIGENAMVSVNDLIIVYYREPEPENPDTEGPPSSYEDSNSN